MDILCTCVAMTLWRSDATRCSSDKAYKFQTKMTLKWLIKAINLRTVEYNFEKFSQGTCPRAL